MSCIPRAASSSRISDSFIKKMSREDREDGERIFLRYLRVLRATLEICVSSVFIYR